MTIFRSLAVAFSLYSRIPMPQFEWKEKDMKYNLAFLPAVGLVIGVLEYLALSLFGRYDLPDAFKIAVLMAIPLAITGGFHVDGFMDTQDAFKSYKSKEDKLKILEDPHIGAFAVISLATCGCFFAMALSLVCNGGDATVPMFLGLIFVLSRIVTGLTSLFLKKARKEGMLHNETNSAGKGCRMVLFAELIVCLGVMIYFDPVLTGCEAAALLLFFLYYRHKTDKEFGGVTGDTAGFFLTVSELFMMLVLGAYVFMRFR